MIWMNLIFFILFIFLLAWIFTKFSKLAKSKNESGLLYGLSAIALLMFGTYLGKQFEQLIFHHSVGIIAALLGPFCCYLYYLYLRNRS